VRLFRKKLQMSVNSLPPDDLPLSYYLVKTCKLWVWDFDDTLIDSTTYIKTVMDPATIRKKKNSELDVEIPQWRYFKRLIDFLLTHGKYVAIASFGTYEIIRAYMDRIFGFNQNFFGKRNIVAPCMAERDSRRFTIPPNKNEYIYQLMKIYRVQDFSRVVLFDDLPSNIADATAIGVVAVQIATPRNGDRDISKMYFGPWVMTDIDNKLISQCEDGFYTPKTGPNTNPSMMNYNTSATNPHATNPLSEPFLDSGFPYAPSAYGTGIGDRKITKKPGYRWNKMNVQNPPLWQNENWQTNGGIQTYETLPKTSAIGGYSLSFWDNDQSVLKQNLENSNSNRSPSRTVNVYEANDIIGITEGFEGGGGSNVNSSNGRNGRNSNSSCTSCKKIGWDWITFSLILIIILMVALCFSVM
jgi:hypothetical protein